MRHCLRVHAIGHRGFVGISGEEFDELKNAKGILANFYDLTENYRVVIQSYRAVEKAKHDAELDHILYSKFGYDDISDARVTLNSPIIGYLASSRYFLDSTDKILPKIISVTQVESFNQFRRNIYDSICEYRFIEALRNYVQHRELPVHSMTHHNYVEDINDIKASDKVSTISLYAKCQTLKKDKKFKKEALKGLPDMINIIFCIRYHMEGIWKIHEYLIQTHSGIADNARAIISNAIERFEATTGESSFGLCITSEETETSVSEQIPLLLDHDDARRAALNKLGYLNNLHKRYVTGKIQKA
jgi:hypothetical protein